MSHIVEINTEVRDAQAVRSACRRLKLDEPVEGTFKLFSDEATGLAVQLSGWNYPVVCNTATGELQYDNFNGRWGDRQQLDRFLQVYAVEKARIEARKKGHTVVEQPLGNGSIRLTIQVGGDPADGNPVGSNPAGSGPFSRGGAA